MAKEGLAKPSRFQVLLPIPKYVNEFVSQNVFEKILNLPNTIFTEVTQIIQSTKGLDPQAVSANPAVSRYLSLQCETAELPGKTLITADNKIYGPSVKVPYQTQYNEMNLTFLCTNDFYERKLFDRWLECIMPTDTNNLRYSKGENTRYMTDLTIIQYDDFIKQIYAVQLIDAFPIGIASQPLSWAEDNFHRLNVQFTYSHYKTLYTGSYDVVGAAAELLGASAGQRLVNPINAGYQNLLTTIFR
jgi:hypothetical protein